MADALCARTCDFCIFFYFFTSLRIAISTLEDSDDGMITRETVLEVHGSYTDPDLHGSANARLSLYMMAGSTAWIVSRRLEGERMDVGGKTSRLTCDGEVKR